MVHHQDSPPGAGCFPDYDPRCPLLARFVAENLEQGLGLQFGLGFLGVGVGIVQQRRPGAHARHAVPRTVPGRQTLALSLRSTSVHMVSSDSSLTESSSCRIRAASSRASCPLAMVPLIGADCTTRRSWPGPRRTRTNISGDAPTRY